MNKVRCRKRQRRGSIVVLIAFLLPVLFILIGFSVDLANMQRTRTELRAATDLAAKATAEALARTEDQNAAINQGKLIASKNKVAGQGLTLQNADFEFGRSTQLPNGKWQFASPSAEPNSVRVVGARTSSSPDGAVGLFFGGLMGRDSFEPTIAATASFINVDTCLVLDRSSSMKTALHETGGLLFTDPRVCSAPNASARWQDLDIAVRVFLDEMDASPGTEYLAMVTFGGAMPVNPDCGGAGDFSVVSLDQDLTPNTSSVEAALTARTTGIWNGNTDIAAGMTTGINVLLNSRIGAQRVMILLTDGQYTEANPVPMASVAAANNITVHTITFGPLHAPSGGDDDDDDDDGGGGPVVNAWIVDMQTIAAATGGTHMHAPDQASLIEAFKALAAQMAELTE